LDAGKGTALTTKFSSPEAYTPKYLAEKILKILNSKDFLEAERKHVTVLFADIKGSLELLADRDPEDARKVLDAVLERMIDTVHRYEGTISHFMGDGIMALFGAPVGHEDHAVRACYAALLMQESIKKYSENMRRTEGFQVQVRIGLNSGQVILRAIRSDLTMDYTAVGQTVHLAARMEQIATPGSVLVTADVVQLVNGYVETKSIGDVPIKGLRTPIEVYELVGVGSVRSRLQAAAARGLSRFVGRGVELEMLQNSLECAIGGHGQVVAVMGEAGVGKSRLLYEFTHSHRVKDCLVLVSNTVAYGRTTPYVPVVDFLKDYFEIDPRDDVRAIRERVTDKLVMSGPLLQETISPILDLLHALPEDDPFRALDPIQRRQQIVQIFKRLVLRESRMQPVILVFEDLHWYDSLSLELLDSLVGSVMDERILLFVTYRSDHQDNWAAAGHYRQVRLRPLHREGIEQLLRDLLGTDFALFSVKRLLMDRAEGNPFFLEEIVRTLVETGVLRGKRGDYRVTEPVTSIQVPPQIQTVISSRIDRLRPEHKRLLQEAAVIGKNVQLALLGMVSNVAEQELRGRLADLQVAEFLYETRLFPDLEYTFKHALTHEVAYESLTKKRRSEIHAFVVESIERLHPERLSEHAERLAHHAFLGEVWPKAFAYLRTAGTRAVERRASREAVDLFQQALEALKHLPDDRHWLERAVDIRFDIRNALQPLGDVSQILEYLGEAEALAWRLDDQVRLGWVSAYLTEHFRMLGKPESASEMGERALAIGQSIGDLSMQVVTNLPMGLLYHALGQYRRATAFFEWNVKRLRGQRLHERFELFGLPSVFSRAFLAYCFAELGEFFSGNLIAEEAHRIANEADHPFSRVYAHLGTGYLHLRKGDFAQAIIMLERALALGQLSQIPVAFAYGTSYLGYALTLAGRVDEGLPFLEQATAEAISTRFVARHSLNVAHLGEAYLLAGRVSDAAAAATRSLKLAHDHKERGHEAYALRLLGEVRRKDDPADADVHYRGALHIARELGMRPLAAHCHWGLAKLYRGTANPAFSGEHTHAAQALFQDMKMTTWLKQVDAEMEGNVGRNPRGLLGR
jgi:class 3 adenylate cyclase/tetratricopeptide (TPR) repeat protein